MKSSFSKFALIFSGILACVMPMELCGDPEGVGSAKAEAVTDQAESADALENGNYRLRARDLIRVTVLREPDLAARVRIDANGEVDLPLVGAVRVAGLTRTDAQREVERTYIEERFLRRPQVTIFIEEYSPREISILGQVRSPGKYPLPVEASVTVVEAITRAGGLTDIARGSDVRLTRLDENGKEVTFRLNVDAAVRGRNRTTAAATMHVEPGDVIYVPESLF